MFALAQEQLERNKRHSPRRTIEPTLLQGIVVCEQCGYGLYRTSTHTTKHKLNYYRCIGSDGYRRLNGPLCTNRPIRQDYLDQFVWSEIIRLLEDPRLIQTEIDRRREAAQKADPLRKREEELRREQARVEKSSERLVTAYQEGLLTLSQLRQRMPALQKQTLAVESELQSLKMAAVDKGKYLQLAESLTGFRSKLRMRAEALDIVVRQQILRLLVKEVLVGNATITLRHSIPIPQSGPGPNGSPGPSSGVTASRPNPGYLLRSGSHRGPLGKGQLYDVLVRLPRAHDAAVGEDGSSPPLHLFDDLRVCLMDDFAHSRERLPTPVSKFLDPFVDECRSGFHLYRLFHIHLHFSGAGGRSHRP
jgi:site-specific DNA recombinase